MGQSPEDLGHASLAGLGREQDMLDIFRFRRRELDLGAALDGLLEGAGHELVGGGSGGMARGTVFLV